jgi:arylsulfatase A
MVKYMDKEVGKLMDTLKRKNLLNNTIVIFYGDNGTPSSITSTWKNTSITGGKSETYVYGTHVPFIVTGPGITPRVKNNIIDFTDILPTVADLAGIPRPTKFGHLDGVSFYGAIRDMPFTPRDSTYLYYKPMVTSKGDRFKIFAREAQYKKYDSTNSNYFFDIINDPLEQHPIINLTDEQKKVRSYLNKVIRNQDKYTGTM